MAEIGLGSLYDYNKNRIKLLPALSKSKIEEGKNKIKVFMCKKTDKYYMLLCRELNDYSIFILNDDIAEFKAAMRDCIVNRGFCKGIDKQEDGAWEIWIQTDKDSLPNAYYFFNCDQCIIPC